VRREIEFAASLAIAAARFDSVSPAVHAATLCTRHSFAEEGAANVEDRIATGAAQTVVPQMTTLTTLRTQILIFKAIETLTRPSSGVVVLRQL